MDVIEIRLKKPIPAHGNTVSTLALREPTGAEIRAVRRLPFLVRGEDGAFVPDPRAILKYAAVCAEVPPSSLSKLSGPDVMAVNDAVMSMFVSDADDLPTLAEVTGRETSAVGEMPHMVSVDAETFYVNTAAAMRYIELLAELNKDQVDALSPAAIARLSLQVVSFFYGGPSEASTS
ncbi:hypothetical protein PPN31119_04532 [Pandoraea pnomenusa]|uniref:Phage tail assembly protein n=1 Tax=Pandoraea pnomenusa TaxID=93220 RepID=A0ABY6WV02_9BURK|nr:hypothetical protein PPN31119_04532 [Pandoraea pnomenusa]